MDLPREVSDAGAGQQAQLLLEGHVWLDDEGDRQVLTHDLVLKRYSLPVDGMPWRLVFEDGFGMAVSESTEDVLFLEEWLPENVFKFSLLAFMLL